MFRRILFCVFLITMGCQNGNAQNVINLEPAITYQTITGWEVTTQSGEDEYKNIFPKYKNVLFDLAVNDLGLNRVRLEIQSGTENPVDYSDQYLKGQISRGVWKQHLYEIINDNDDPNVINPNGFHFSMLDYKIDNVVLPLKQLLEAKGEKLYINLNYVDFGSSSFEHYNNPEEYAEFVLATYQHIQSKYGFVPDAWEMILEPDNSAWNGTHIGNCILAAAARLEANGFAPKFIAPSTTNMGNAISYFDAMSQAMSAKNVSKYLAEISYHRYSGVSDSNLQTIASRALQYGINTAQLEHIGSGYQDLHKDLKIGRNSAWQQYTLAYPDMSDNGAKLYMINTGNPNNPKITMSSRAKFLRQYFKFIRSGAKRIEATSSNNSFEPLAFINTNGKYVVVVKANSGGSFAVQGLPADIYGIKYTTSSHYNIDSPNVTISAGQPVNASIPAAGVITVYAIGADNPLPIELSSFTALADDTKVTLKWETGSELGNMGFYVYRSEMAGGPFKKISTLIEGAGNSGVGRNYEYIDKDVKLNKTYFYYLEDVDIHGIRHKSDTIQVIVKPSLPEPPKEYKLFQNYPNPFNPETWIPFQLAKDSKVAIRIYNVTGQLIKTIELGYKPASAYIDKSKAAYWDGKNDNGEKLASGAYFYELRSEKFTAIRKMILLK